MQRTHKSKLPLLWEPMSACLMIHIWIIRHISNWLCAGKAIGSYLVLSSGEKTLENHGGRGSAAVESNL